MKRTGHSRVCTLKTTRVSGVGCAPPALKLRLCALPCACCGVPAAPCLVPAAPCLVPAVLCLLCPALLRRLKALSPRLSSSERSAAVDEALEQMRRTLTGMAGALGADHLLVTAGTRYMAQLSVMLSPQRQ